jgi:superoxide dismutase
MAFELPDLPYAYDALGPYMSAETLEFHHDKHHQAYVSKGNELAEAAGMADKSLEEIMKASFGIQRRAVQQCRPALQPRPFLEVDEAEWRRHLAARRVADGHRFRSGRL